MKILIVDDNTNNRMLLHMMLDEYAEKNSTNFLIEEAENGQLAYDRAKTTHFDMIFMDIMMPVMDGLAATKLIHRANKATMIIAVSAVEDDESKKVILSNGAEDYLSKPLNGDIFSSRINNYIHLINSRHNRNNRKLVQEEPHNLFTNKVRSFYIHFYADDEDQISEFWENYLQDEAIYEGLSDVIRLVYSIGLVLLQNKIEISIYEEQNDQNLYLTLESNALLDLDWIQVQVEKNSFEGNFKVKGKRLSIELVKKLVKSSAPTTAFVDSSSQNTLQSSSAVSKKNTPAHKQVYKILDTEDHQDLQEFINRLNSVLLIIGSSDIEVHEVDEMILALGGISKSITSYNEFYKISAAMNKLQQDINEHKSLFMEKSIDMGPLAKAFGRDLSKWFDSLFVTGAPSINFLDDSIISNTQMISSLIQSDNVSNDDSSVDDLFF